MAPGIKPLLALDTNVLFDLADERDFAETVLEVLREEKIVVKVPPTVMVEIEFEMTHPSSPEKEKRDLPRNAAWESRSRL